MKNQDTTKRTMTWKINLPPHELTPYRILTKQNLEQRMVAPLAQVTDWGHAVLKIPEVWRTRGVRGRNVKVAVLDTGISLGHPDLVFRNTFSVDLTGQGIDDIVGHGSHCSGIICASDNGVGVVGVAPSALLHVVKVLGNDGSGSLEGLVSGIAWCVEKKVHVISLSLGANSKVVPTSLKNVLDKAMSAGILVVVAGGNSGPAEGTVTLPGIYLPLLTVGALDSTYQLAPWSGRGKEIDVVAPGVKILSTYKNGGYAVLSGTSMSTPFVAGIAALFIERCGQLGVKVSQALFEGLVKSTARDLGIAGADSAFGHGLVDCAALFFSLEKMAAPPPPPPPPSISRIVYIPPPFRVRIVKKDKTTVILEGVERIEVLR